MHRTKITRRIFLLLTVILTPIAAYAVLSERWGTILGVNLVGLILLAGTVMMLNLLPLSGYAYSVLLPVLILCMLTLNYVRFNLATLLLLLLVLLCLLVAAESGEISRYGISIAVTVLFSAVVMWVYDALILWFLPGYYDFCREWSRVSKSLVLLLLGGVYLGILYLIIHAARGLLKRAEETLSRAAEKYREIEIFILLMLAVILIFLAGMEIFRFKQDDTPIFMAVMIFLILFQILCIRLLMKVVALKERMKITEDDHRSLSLYNRDLEHNLDDLRGVRHDVKNLFLTMGGFVERSGDAEMKRFYEESIIPFVRDTVQKSDLQSKLKDIRDEALKSFLYYKIMEGIEAGIATELEISLTDETVFSVERMDLVRLLGIFMDNAMEEAGLAGSRISLRIAETEDSCSFSIRNGTREETRRRGVVAGTTNKGLGRGNGLDIAGKIIGKYDNIVLNSYFKEEDFIQHLVIMKLPK